MNMLDYFWILVALCICGALIPIALFFIKLNKAVDEATKTLNAIREKVLPLAEQITKVASEVEGLTHRINNQVDKISLITQVLETFVLGKTILSASKAAFVGKNTLSIVVDGLKQGISILRSHTSSKSCNEEETENV